MKDKEKRILMDKQVTLVKQYTRLHLPELDSTLDKQTKADKLMEYVHTHLLVLEPDDDDDDKRKNFIKTKSKELRISIEEAEYRFTEGIDDYQGELVLIVLVTAEELASYCTWIRVPPGQSALLGEVEAHSYARAEVRRIIMEQLGDNTTE